MKLSYPRSLCALSAALLVAGTSSAATIDFATAQPHVSGLSMENKVITVKHIFAVGYYNNETTSCGARVEFSDGTPAKNYTLTKSTTPKQVVEERQYSKAGTYTVTLSGVAWGGYKACLGSQTSTTTVNPNSLGKVTSITTQYPKMMMAPGGLEVPFTVHGSGEHCVLHIESDYTTPAGPFNVDVEVKTFPVTVSMKFPDMAQKYRIYSRPGAGRLGIPSCQGDADIIFDTYPKPAAKPYITGIIAQSLVSGTPYMARQDDALILAVNGNVSNTYDKTLQCGWSVFLVDTGGQGKLIAKGAQFGYSHELPSGALAGFPPGAYTLHVKSSAADDTLAEQNCASSADKPFTLLPGVGKIKDVKLVAGITKNSVLNTVAGLWITPIIDGPMCNYRVTRYVGSSGIYAPNVHKPGVSDKQEVIEYGADETTVTVTVHAIGNDNLMNMGCLGSATKTIVVKDDPSLPTQVK